MQIIKNRQVLDDDWMLLKESATIPDVGNVIVSLESWNQEYELLRRRSGKTGLVLRSEETPEAIEHRDQLPLIAIEFPKFTDGRGYSHARRLRERLSYTGELRAIGNVLRDQLFYMLRCGIDSFVLQSGKDIDGALTAFDEFSVTYQGAADDQLPLYRRASRG
jgi:uncharacterized protein (DUF934 family)